VTALIPEGLEPVAVWDDTDPEWAEGTLSDRFFWTTGHSPIGHVYRARRIAFYLLDGPFAVIYRYRNDFRGYIGRERPPSGFPEDEPVIVPLAELPPEHLLRPA
jgi:hypothetical protein